MMNKTQAEMAVAVLNKIEPMLLWEAVEVEDGWLVSSHDFKHKLTTSSQVVACLYGFLVHD